MYSRRTLVRIHGPVRRLKASGSLPVGESARPGCAPLPWRRMPLHVRSAIPLLPPPLAPRALRRRAHTRIRWRMSIKQSTLSVQRPMPHWLLSSTTLAIQTSVMARSAGRSSTPPLKCARSCCRCPLVKRVRVGWTRSSMSWMRASALGPCRKTPNKRLHLTDRILRLVKLTMVESSEIEVLDYARQH